MRVAKPIRTCTDRGPQRLVTRAGKLLREWVVFGVFLASWPCVAGAGSYGKRSSFGGAAGRDVRPAAHLLSFASPKESRQRKGDPTCRVPSLRCGQPAMLGHGAALRNSLCAFGALLGQPQRVRARSMVLLRSPCPPHALRFSARPEGIGEHGPSLRSAPNSAKAAEQAMPATAVAGLVPATGGVPPRVAEGGRRRRRLRGVSRSRVAQQAGGCGAWGCAWTGGRRVCDSGGCHLPPGITFSSIRAPPPRSRPAARRPPALARWPGRAPARRGSGRTRARRS